MPSFKKSMKVDMNPLGLGEDRNKQQAAPVGSDDMRANALYPDDARPVGGKSVNESQRHLTGLERAERDRVQREQGLAAQRSAIAEANREENEMLAARYGSTTPTERREEYIILPCGNTALWQSFRCHRCCRNPCLSCLSRQSDHLR